MRLAFYVHGWFWLLVCLNTSTAAAFVQRNSIKPSEYIPTHQVAGASGVIYKNNRLKPFSVCPYLRYSHCRNHVVQLHMSMNDSPKSAKNDGTSGSDEFWLQQKQLILEMQESSEASLRAEMREKFAQQRQALVGDTAYLGFFICCALWMIFSNPFVALSYAFGNTLGVLYAYGLGRYVETIGAKFGDEGTTQGAGVGQARFAFIVLLFIFLGKFHSAGLMEIPSIAGFFTYQLASLGQALKDNTD